MDALPPDPPAAVVRAPGDIYPLGPVERDLCARASHPDWLYLGALFLLDAGAIWFGSSATIKYLPGQGVGDVTLRLTGPAAIGLTWGATLGGAWLAAPKCDPRWIGENPREGAVRASWPLALSIALASAATAPIINGIAVGSCDSTIPSCQSGLPAEWTTLEREAHVFVAAVAGFGGALVPYLLPPRTWSAARELDRVRFAADGRGAYVQYGAGF